jgi:UDP-N-acetyl-2-amino-2-deoxyglucuronate dehydrogenase
MSIRFGLVGCGRIAKRHAELLGLGQIPGASLAAVCDIVPARAKAIGERFGVPSFTDMDTMMQSGLCDAVSVLTPSGDHADHVTRLAVHRKPILVEKPMALTLEDADRIIWSCAEAGIPLFVVKQNRFNVPVVKLREALEGGRFGRLVMGTIRVRWCRTQAYYAQDSWRGTWQMDGGVLTNQASHHVDLLQWMMGEVDRVYARSTTALVDTEAEDTAVAILRFKSGALGTIEATTATRPRDLEGSISVLGERGSVEVGGFAVNEMRVWQFAEPQPGDDTIMERFSVNPPNVYGFGHQAYYEHVVGCLQRGLAPLVDGLEGKKSLQLLHSLYESIETGREIAVGEPTPHVRLGKARA